MKAVSRKWAVPVLLALTVGLCPVLLSAMEDPFPLSTCTFPRNVEMTSQEVIFTWLEEQAGEAKGFFNDHEELFVRIAETVLDPEITEVYQGFSISSGYLEPGTLYLTEYRTIGGENVSLGYGAYPDGEYYRSISDLSPELEPVLAELLALRQPLSLTYTAPEDFFYNGPLLQVGYSSTEFPTAIFCDVSLRYDPELSSEREYNLGNGWYIWPEYHYMYGL